MSPASSGSDVGRGVVADRRQPGASVRGRLARGERPPPRPRPTSCPPSPDARPAARLALLRADMALRWQDGDRVGVESYRGPLSRPGRRGPGRPDLRGILPPRGRRRGPRPGRVRGEVPGGRRRAPPRARHPRAGRLGPGVALDPGSAGAGDPLPRGRPDDRRVPAGRGAGPGGLRPRLPAPRSGSSPTARWR